jgi:hypothetical protein
MLRARLENTGVREGVSAGELPLSRICLIWVKSLPSPSA